MVVAPGRPAQLTDALHGLGGALLQVVTVRGEKLEGLFPAALVAPDRPAQHQLTAQIRAAGGGGPLAGRIDQIADLVHLQGQRQIAAALDRADQRIARLDAAALTGHLIESAGQGPAFDQGM